MGLQLALVQMTWRLGSGQGTEPAPKLTARTAGSLPLTAVKARSQSLGSAFRYQKEKSSAADLSKRNLVALATKPQKVKMEAWEKEINFTTYSNTINVKFKIRLRNEL